MHGKVTDHETTFQRALDLNVVYANYTLHAPTLRRAGWQSW